MAVRTGIGYDVHRLEPGHPLWLGGVNIPFEEGLAGHSDGDVLVHALVDALLGAAGLGDMGTYFPSSDPQYRGVSSLLFLRHAATLLKQRGWRVVNLDATIVAERPRLAPFSDNMREVIAESMSLSQEQVNIKSKTSDGLGFTGRGEGIAAYAIATIEGEG
ncbi:MAG: 2-C-methyl-D-erythritol 2,4-cyclodiphosphate synthase [Dehalococcoidia bacterium]|nr:2-C-methyl-D-erythritol 2,4-cyclodiphosphate synthase [Dehalococcoidia bacterium]